MRGSKSILVLACLIVLIASAVGIAGDYISSVGRFHFTYPENWIQIDYRTVDYYLSRTGADRETFMYEAVFADSLSRPFHAGAYLILAVESIGEVKDYQVDSILIDLSQTLQQDITYLGTQGYLAQLSDETINYDSLRQEISVLMNIEEGGSLIKKNLWIMKLFDNGVANFYFFSPDSLLTENLGHFESIMTSFSTEDIESVLNQEKVKLAEIELDSEEATPAGTYVLMIGALVVLIVVVLRLRRKTKKRS
jgi:hypothetical protein